VDITSNLVNIHWANTVCVTFQDQKNSKKSETITMIRTNNPIAYPFTQAAAIANRVLGIPNTTPDSTINTTYQSGDNIFQLSSTTALTRLHRKAAEIGPTILGHSPEDISLHSGRSAAAMAMVLASTPAYLVMLFGWWKFDAFLKYIRKQVAEFSNQVSSNMIRIMTFFHPPTTALVSWRTIAPGQEAQAMATLPRINWLAKKMETPPKNYSNKVFSQHITSQWKNGPRLEHNLLLIWGIWGGNLLSTKFTTNTYCVKPSKAYPIELTKQHKLRTLCFLKFVDPAQNAPYWAYKIQTTNFNQLPNFYPIRSSGGTRVFVIPPSNH
jgi:hypothetical protein